jgi:hypothetical protein
MLAGLAAAAGGLGLGQGHKKRRDANVRPVVVKVGVTVGHQDVLIHSASSGAAYPSAANTPHMLDATTLAYYDTSGTQHTTTLTTHVGDWTITTPNQVIDSMHITGSLIIQASGVIVRKTLIDSWSVFGVDVENTGGYSLTLEDSIVDGTAANGGTCIVNSNLTVRRCNVFGAENGFDVGVNATITDCYVHDLYNPGAPLDPHADCLQTNDGSVNINISHNTLLCRGSAATGGLDGTSCIISPQASTNPHDWLIDDNVMAGGAFSLYGPQNGAGTNIVISNNKFWTYYEATVGAFGPWTDCLDETISGNSKGAFAGGLTPNDLLLASAWSGTPLTT